MRLRLRFAVALLIAGFAGLAMAQQAVSQGPGSTSGVFPWRVAITSSTGATVATAAIGSGYITAGAPAATVSISTVTAAATGLTAGSCYRVACSVACFFRTGSGTPTALTSDASFFGPAVERICLKTGSTAIAFITATGTGTCSVNLMTDTP